MSGACEVSRLCASSGWWSNETIAEYVITVFRPPVEYTRRDALSVCKVLLHKELAS